MFEFLTNLTRKTPEVDEALERDLALSKDDLDKALRAGTATRGRFVAMAAEFGVNEHQLDSERWRVMDIIETCSNCNDVGGCRRYLAGDKTAFDPCECPNAVHFQELADK